MSLKKCIFGALSLVLAAPSLAATPLDSGTWVKVGNMSATDAGVFNGNCDLAPSGCNYGVDAFGDFWAPSPRTFLGQEILFVSKDRKVWGVVEYAKVLSLKGTDNFSPNLTWRDVGIYGASIGSAVGNVLWRPSTFTAYDTSYDPWLTLRGSHCAHLVSDLYPVVDDCNLVVWGETDFAAPVHSSLKNYTGGIEVYVSAGAPIVAAKISGTQASNGWYVSPVTLAWSVIQSVSSSGCGTVGPLADTKGKTYTCTASNDVGSTSVAQLIKQDTVKPSATITVPSFGATYKVNSTIKVKYSCSDAGSGVARCTGTAANGASFKVAAAGTYTFTVNSTDNAGNSSSTTITYKVK